MKKIYEMPSIELKALEISDIVTASSAVVSPDEFKATAVLDVDGTKRSVTAVATWNENWNSTFGL